MKEKTTTTTTATTTPGTSYIDILREKLQKKASPAAPKPHFIVNTKNLWSEMEPESDEEEFYGGEDQPDTSTDAEMPAKEDWSAPRLYEAEQALFPKTSELKSKAAKYAIDSDAEDDTKIAELTALIALTESKSKRLEQTIQDMADRNAHMERKVTAQTTALQALSSQLNAQSQQQEKLANQQDTMMTLLQAMQGTLNQLANTDPKPGKAKKERTVNLFVKNKISEKKQRSQGHHRPWSPPELHTKMVHQLVNDHFDLRSFHWS